MPRKFRVTSEKYYQIFGETAYTRFSPEDRIIKIIERDREYISLADIRDAILAVLVIKYNLDVMIKQEM